MKKTIRVVWVLAFCLFAVTACSNLVSETSGPPDNLPKPESGKSLIYGTLVNVDTQEPVGGEIYLAKDLAADNPELPPTISFSLQSDPSAVYDRETGQFYLNNIEPADNYVLIVHYGPGMMIVVNQEDSEYPIEIQVQADQILDLGTITTREP